MPCYDKWAFADSVNVGTGFASDSYLSLDQGMIMAALGNYLGGDIMRTSFWTADVTKKIRPVLAVEEFNTQPRDLHDHRHGGRRHLVGPGAGIICALGDETPSRRHGW